jgi:hypothetical protein
MQATNGGILRLNGNATSNFLNSGGRLRVISDVELVNSAVFRNETGGRVEGAGTFWTSGGTFTNVSGTVAPGLSIGRLTVNGDFTQAANGTLDIELAGPTPATEHDQLTISGSAGLGGLLDLRLMNDFFPDPYEPLTLITAAGGVVNVFDTVGGVDYAPNLGLAVTYSPTSVEVRGALLGDANLDGLVDGVDFGIWNATKFTAGRSWATGDFNGDGQSDQLDFGIWNDHKFTSVTMFIPEPGVAIVLFCLGVLYQVQLLIRDKGR